MSVFNFVLTWCFIMNALRRCYFSISLSLSVASSHVWCFFEVLERMTENLRYFQNIFKRSLVSYSPKNRERIHYITLFPPSLIHWWWNSRKNHRDSKESHSPSGNRLITKRVRGRLQSKRRSIFEESPGDSFPFEGSSLLNLVLGRFPSLMLWSRPLTDTSIIA